MSDPSLTPAQRQYFAASGVPAQDPRHACQVSISFGEPVDAAALKSAWRTVVAACPALRAKFDETGPASSPTPDAFAWEALDWESSPPDNPAAAWAEIVANDAAKPVAAAGEAPTRFTFIALPDGTGHALWTFHGAALDHGSIAAAIHVWLAVYDALRAGGAAPEIPEFPVPGPPTPEARASEADAWKAVLRDAGRLRRVLVLPLPPRGPEPKRERVAATLGREERARFAAAEESVPFEKIARAAWALLVARATGSDTVALIECRERGDDPFGPARACTLAPALFVPRAQLGALEFARTAPGRPDGSLAADPAEIAAASGVDAADLASAPVFEVRGGDINALLGKANPRWMRADFKLLSSPPFPLAAVLTLGDRPEFAVEFDSATYSAEAASSLLRRWVALASAFADAPDKPLAEFSVLAESEDAAERTPDPPPAFGSLVPRTIHETLADLARDLRDAPAVETGALSLTFQELDSKANQLARHLKKRGVEPGSRVGLLLDRSTTWAVALVAAIKADAVPVLLDPQTHGFADPENLRKLGIARLVVGSTAEDSAFASFDPVATDKETAAVAEQKSRPPHSDATVDSPAIAWIDPASGEIRSASHAAALRAFQNSAQALGLQVGDRALVFSPLSLPAAATEFFSALLSGACTVIRPDDSWPTRTAFQEFLESAKISALSVTSGFWGQWVHYLSELKVAPPPGLRAVAACGWRVLPSALDAWRNLPETPRLVIRDSALPGGLESPFVFDASDDAPAPGMPVPLGRPAPGIAASVRSPDGAAMPRGFPGVAEIRAAAAGDALIRLGETFRGTGGEFYSRPWVEAARGICGPDNGAEAIEFVASSHPDVFECVAEFRPPGGAPCLWIVPRDTELGEPNGFREFLRERLPAPLVPQRIACVPKVPLLPDGTLDREALATPESDAPGPATAPSRLSKPENDLRRIVSRALGNRKIGPDDMVTDGRTKPAVAKHLHAAVSREGFEVALSDFEAAFSVRSLMRAIRGREASGGGVWSPMVPLKPSGSRTPILFVHDLCGTAKIYDATVAAIDPQQPCYAIAAKGVAEPDAPHRSVGEMVEAYLDAIRVFDPDGPYRLAGFGFGGLIAYEIAARLGRDSVDLLAVIGTEPPVPADSAVARLSASFKNSLSGILGGGEQKLSPRQRRARDTPVYQANAEAARAYKAPSTTIEAHLFLPESGYPPFRKAQAAWLRLAPESRFYQVPCACTEMLEEPAAAAIADALSKLGAELEIETEEDPNAENPA